MLEAFKSSPYFAQKDELHKKKWDRQDYANSTIEKSLSLILETAEESTKIWEAGQAEKLAKKQKKKPLQENDAVEQLPLQENMEGNAETPPPPKKVVPQARKILNMLEEMNVKYLRDTTNANYIAIPEANDTSFQLLELTDSRLKHFINGKYSEAYGSYVSNDAVSQALSMMNYYAAFINKEVLDFSLRIAKKPDALYYDLSDPARSTVKITPSKWKLSKGKSILFKNYRAQTAQVVPQMGESNVTALLDFINIKEEYRCLFLCWVVACFIPEFPHPILSISGEPGAGKSTCFEFLKKIIDPTAVDKLNVKADEKDFMAGLIFNYFLPYDNASYISADRSDWLCKLITGDSFITRELYTTSDAKVFNFRRIVGLNGVNLTATKSDLLDRCILIDLKRIEDEKRCTEAELKQKFDSYRPYIMGSIFTIVAEAMRIYPQVTLDNLPRMADFAVWGYAIGEAMKELGLGFTGAQFLHEYKMNRDKQNEEAIANDPVAKLIIALMVFKPQGWKGSATQLLNELKELAYREGVDVKDKPFKNSMQLVKQFSYVRNRLKQKGIILSERFTNHNGERLYTISRL
jgi:hypothetical protein